MSSHNAGPWSSLSPQLSPWILETLANMGFSQMAPVQSTVIPLFMQHKDVVVEAVTGSGKTLAFVVPILEKLYRRETPLASNELGALIISPTRELAKQISNVIETFLSSNKDVHGISHMLMIGGGRSIQLDFAAFKNTGPDILVGTPGRLEEFFTGIGRSLVNTKELEVLVMDEADRLLDMGFQSSITSILSHLPKQRRTGLFSATMTDALSELVRTGLRNPVKITVKVQDLKTGMERRTPASLDVEYLVVKPNQRLVHLIHILREFVDKEMARKFIVYFATGACVDYFYKLLSNYEPLTEDISVYSMHGRMPQKRRTITFNGFTSTSSKKGSVLFCTDVTARGIDLPDVDCVIQVDPPQDPKAFAHRCGRAGRAGRSGRAIVFLNEGREEDYVEFMKLRKIHMKRLDDREDLKLEHDKVFADLGKIVLTDREYYDFGMKAFVSFIRAYSKHDASYIFRLKDLDIGKVAENYALLHLPKMPEIDVTKVTYSSFDINMDTYSYKDKAREKHRLEELNKAKEEKQKDSSASISRKTNTAWSDKFAAKERKIQRQEKKKRKREYLARQTAESIANQKKGDIDGEEADDDWDELKREQKLAKKVKQGKMKSGEMHSLLGNADGI